MRIAKDSPMRSIYLMAASLALFVVAPAGQSASAQSEHSDHYSKCAKVCSDCQLKCDSCFTHCLLMLVDGKKDHLKSAQFCVDCADCCKICAGICARGGPLARVVLDCCAKCCDECTTSCEKVSSDKHMADCAKACRECSKECRDMLRLLVK